MHSLSTSFVLGYHGCSNQVAEAVLNGEPFVESRNDYDWLGHGIYFWESNPVRGLEFYKEARERRGLSSADAAVVGAVIDLGHCLDLSSSRGVAAVVQAHGDLKAAFKVLGTKMPVNHAGKDLLLRNLDCAVINYLHNSRKKAGLISFDSVRGIFQEGHRAYRRSGFYKRTHVQIAVCDRTKIKGVFKVPPGDLD